MEKTTSQKLRLGNFIIIGLTLPVVAVYFIGNKQKIFGKTNHLKAFFDNVSSLQVEDNVRLSGINVGTVRSLEMINDSTIIVCMFLDKTIFPHIKKNAIATVGFNGAVSTLINYKYYFRLRDVSRCEFQG